MSIEIIKPFGPSIAKITIPSEIISGMNKYVEEVIEDEKRSKDLNYGNQLAGNVQQEFLLDLEFMKKINWGEFLGKVCQEWINKEHNISIKKFEIISSWIVRQFENEYNPIHFHDGHISGVGYLKVPDDMGKTIQKNKSVQHNGKLILVDGSKKFLCNPTYIITPKVGDFYLFPSYMMHTVYPFSKTLEERRSVSFNAKIDDDSATLR
ncbi:2OG-Fe(II) oxygenase family protein [Candidatus Pelagibacter sp.]|nr:2OG-Fe(II) oxygenase family protein [Candidatus Pelagibacter sp.]